MKTLFHKRMCAARHTGKIDGMHPLTKVMPPSFCQILSVIASTVSVVVTAIVPSGHRWIILPGRRNHTGTVADSLLPLLCLTNIPQSFPRIFFCFTHCLPGTRTFSAPIPTATVIHTSAAAIASTPAATVIHASAAAVIAAPTTAAKAAAAAKQ